ncbi:MAG: DUF2490 domain-containing protein [Chlamydiales bacterium]
MRYFFLLIWCSFTAVFAAHVNDNNLNQFWWDAHYNVPINNDIRMLLETQWRYGQGAGTLFFYYFHASFLFPVNKWLGIAPGYRQQYDLRPQRVWKPAYDPFIDVYIKFSVHDWKIDNRLRGQYYWFANGPNLWLGRWRISVRTPWIIGKGGLNPLVENEILLLEYYGFQENRFTIGADVQVAHNTRGMLLYLSRIQYVPNGLFLTSTAQKIIQDRWRYQNCVWIKLTYSY